MVDFWGFGGFWKSLPTLHAPFATLEKLLAQFHIILPHTRGKCRFACGKCTFYVSKTAYALKTWSAQVRPKKSTMDPCLFCVQNFCTVYPKKMEWLVKTPNFLDSENLKSQKPPKVGRTSGNLRVKISKLVLLKF